MSIQFIDDSSDNLDDLPWSNEFDDGLFDQGNVYRVEKFKLSQKGILTVTRFFKGFVFKGSSTYSLIIEAIGSWKSEQRLDFAIVCAIKSNGKIALATDSAISSVVIFESKKDILFKYEDTDLQPQGKKENPFMAQLPQDTSTTVEPAKTGLKGSSSPKTKPF